MSRHLGKQKKSNNFKVFFLGITLFFSIYLAVTLFQQDRTLKDLRARKSSQETQIMGIQTEIEELNEEIAQKDSLEFAEKVAREKLGMIKPREYIYVDEANPEGSLTQDVKAVD